MSEFFSKWKTGLSRTSKAAFGRLAGILGASEITSRTWDELEALLIQADVGIETESSVLTSLKESVNRNGLTKSSELKQLLRAELRSRLLSPPPLDFSA